MSPFGFGVGDIIAISKLAVKLYTSYKDAPDLYRHISEEARAFQVLVDIAQQHCESTTMSTDVYHNGQEVLKSCQSVLEDLDAFLEKYMSVASTNQSVVKKLELSKEDILTLKIRLISNTGLLNGFIRRCEYLEIQAKLNNILDLYSTNRNVSMDSITSFAESPNARKAFKEFCRNLSQLGVTAEMIKEKGPEILNIFKSHSVAISGQTCDGNTADQSALNKNQPPSDLVQLPIDHLLGPCMLDAAWTGSTRRFVTILKCIGNINLEDGWKETALHKAAEKGHEVIVQLLLEKGALVGAINWSNSTPLHLATQHGHIGTVELLLNHGASIEAMDECKNTPLHLAVRRKYNIATLNLAIQNHLADIVGLLLDNGTPSHLAARERHISMVELLLRKGASVEVKNLDNKTPLDLAAEEGHTDIVKLLQNKESVVHDNVA